MKFKRPRPQMTAFREREEMSVRQMAKVCRCSPGLLYGIEYEGLITHPNIASRIAAAYMLNVDGYNDLVADEHRAEKLPKVKMPPENNDVYKALCEGRARH